MNNILSNKTIIYLAIKYRLPTLNSWYTVDILVKVKTSAYYTHFTDKSCNRSTCKIIDWFICLNMIILHTILIPIMIIRLTCRFKTNTTKLINKKNKKYKELLWYHNSTQNRPRVTIDTKLSTQVLIFFLQKFKSKRNENTHSHIFCLK